MPASMARHLLTIGDLDAATLHALLADARASVGICSCGLISSLVDQ